MKTVQYYNDNAQAFYDRTIDLDVFNSYRKFLEKLPEKAHILDAGCGVGRDIKYFLSQDHQVTAFDASSKMVELSTLETGLKVKQATFQDLEEENIFDGVWAEVSLIHVPYSETRDIYKKIHRSLKPGGIFYASYKYGADYMLRGERDFYNMNEENIKPYLKDLFDVIDMWKQQDNRSKIDPSPDFFMLNFIARKS